MYIYYLPSHAVFHNHFTCTHSSYSQYVIVSFQVGPAHAATAKCLTLACIATAVSPGHTTEERQLNSTHITATSPSWPTQVASTKRIVEEGGTIEQPGFARADPAAHTSSYICWVTQ